MPKQLLPEARFNWSGGLNSAANPDQLGIDELIDAQNVRLDGQLGALEKRSGSRRLHATAVAAGASVDGVVQWDAPSGKQLVAIAGGNLYHKLQSPNEFADFTEVVPAVGDEFSTTAAPIFVPFRSTSANAALVLFIASGGKLYTWDGTSLTRIDGTSNAPTAELLTAYHTRLFAVDSDFVKHLFWSHVGDGEDWTVVVNDLSTGGNSVVDTLTGEAITALGVVGSSLAVATEDSLVRFSGYADDDIRVEQDTEGISSGHGAAGARMLRQAEEFLATLTAEGPYLVEEEGVRPIGLKVEPTFDGLDRSNLADAAIRYHRGRRELWFAVERSADTGNQSVYAFSFRLQAWTGPWSYSFAIVDLARYEGPNGEEQLVAACGDGFVRHMDTGSRDDVLSDGTAGSTYELIAELPPLLFETGPAEVKALRRAILNAEASASATLSIETGFDGAALTGTAKSGLSGTEPRAIRFDLSGQGNRLRLRLRDGSADEITRIVGLQVFAHAMQRIGAV